MNQKLKLNTNKVLEKQFNIDIRGYNCTEVDAFLDTIANDYDVFGKIMVQSIKIIKELEDKNARLTQKLSEMNKEKVLIEHEMSSLEAYSQSNTDLLKRVSALEKKVFGDKGY